MKKLGRAAIAQIITTWHGPLPVRAIAQRFGVTWQTVNKQWAEAKAAGILPNALRPHFGGTELAAAPPPSLTRVAAGPDWIGLPSAIELAPLPLAAPVPAPDFEHDDPADRDVRVPDGDPLLKALRRAHGKDPRRQFDDVTWQDKRKSHTPDIAARIRAYGDSLTARAITNLQKERAPA